MILRRQLRASFVRHEATPEVAFERRRRVKGLMILLVSALGLLGFMQWIRHSQEQHLQKIMLRQQLWQMRSALLLYNTQFGKMPSDLDALARATVKVSNAGSSMTLVENLRRDGKGRIVDPLGYPYRYDPRSGVIASSAPCCQHW